MHYPSDVLGGAALGFGLGMLTPGLGVPHDRGPPVRPRRRRQRASPGDPPRTRQRRRPRPAGALTSRRSEPPRRREDRHRRPAERRQVDPLQRAHAAPAPRRAITRSRPSTRTSRWSRSPTTAGAGGRDRGLERARPRDDRVPRHRRARAGARRRERAWATSSWPRSARPTRSVTWSALIRAAGSLIRRAAIDPGEDIDLIETELLAADLEQAERRLERVAKQARSGDKEAIAERDWLERVVEALGVGRARSARSPFPTRPAHAPRSLFALTSKPILYVANVDEGVEEVPEAVASHARGRGGRPRSRSRPGSRSSSAISTTSARRRRCARSSGSPSRGSRA